MQIVQIVHTSGQQCPFATDADQRVKVPSWRVVHTCVLSSTVLYEATVRQQLGPGLGSDSRVDSRVDSREGKVAAKARSRPHLKWTRWLLVEVSALQQYLEPVKLGSVRGAGPITSTVITSAAVRE